MNVAEKREYDRQRRERLAGPLRAQREAYRAAHAAKIRTRKAEYYQRNRIRILARVAARQARLRKPAITLEEWFWSHVDSSGGPDVCWPWIGPRTGVSAVTYVRVRWQGQQRMATHIALSLGRSIEVGPDEQARHVVCDNPPCVNPAHLEPGSALDNSADKVAKGRQTRGDNHPHRRHPELLPRGLTHPRGNARLSWDTVAVIRRRVAHGETQRAVAKSLGINPSTVSLVVSGKTWAGPSA